MKNKISKKMFFSLNLLVSIGIIVPSFVLSIKTDKELFDEKKIQDGKFSNETIQINSSSTDSKKLPTEIFNFELQQYAKPHYNNPNEAPGFGVDNIKILLVKKDNRQGTILFKAFPAKYLNNGTLTDNDLQNPAYFQLMQLNGLQKSQPTTFLNSINLNINDINPILENNLPSGWDNDSLISMIFNSSKGVKLLLEQPPIGTINIPPNFSFNSIEILNNSVTNKDSEGTKQFIINLSNYFDSSGNIITSGQKLESPIITISGFGKDILGNGQVVNSSTNTIFEIDEKILVKNDNGFNSKLASEINNLDVGKIIQKGNFKISSAFNFDAYDFKIVENSINNFLGELEIELSIPKYIQNGKVIEKTKNIKTKVSGFGQDLFNQGLVTPKDISTEFVATGTYNFELNEMPSNVKKEKLIEYFSSKEVLINGINNNKYEIEILDRNDSTGSIFIRMYVSSYVKDGELIFVSEEELSNIKPEVKKPWDTFVTINGFLISNEKQNLDYLWITIGSSIGIIAILIASIAILVYRHRKQLEKNGIIIDRVNFNKMSNLIKVKKPKKLVDKEEEKSIPKITYEEYYAPPLKSESFDMDDIISDLTIDIKNNQEDTIDRMMKELDEKEM